MSAFDFNERFESAADRLPLVPEQRKRLAAKAVPFNIPYLDDIAYGILPIDFIVLGAKTGAGKTTLGRLFAQNAANAGYRVYHFALEAHRLEIEQRMLFGEICAMLFETDPRDRPDDWRRFTYGAYAHARCEKVCEVYEWAAIERLRDPSRTLSTFYREKQFTAEDIQRLFHSIQGGADLIVIDHLHDVDSIDTNENRAMKEIVTSISTCVNSTETPVIAVAHLRKENIIKPRIVPDLAEFHGSSEITKYATKVITLGPARDRRPSDPWLALTYMQVAKDRVVGATPFVAMTAFDLRRNCYGDEYYLGYPTTKDPGKWESIKYRDQRPVWADGDERQLPERPKKESEDT